MFSCAVRQGFAGDVDPTGCSSGRLVWPHLDFRYSFVYPPLVLSDHEAARISEGTERTKDATTLVRWIRALLDDRRARSALILRLSRQLHHVRGRLAQATRYLDGLLKKAHEDSREPWPDKAVCDQCGAPLDRVKTTPREPTGHHLANEHPDGTKCHAQPNRMDAPATRPQG